MPLGRIHARVHWNFWRYHFRAYNRKTTRQLIPLHGRGCWTTFKVRSTVTDILKHVDRYRELLPVHNTWEGRILPKSLRSGVLASATVGATVYLRPSVATLPRCMPRYMTKIHLSPLGRYFHLPAVKRWPEPCTACHVCLFGESDGPLVAGVVREIALSFAGQAIYDTNTHAAQERCLVSCFVRGRRH